MYVYAQDECTQNIAFSSLDLHIYNKYIRHTGIITLVFLTDCTHMYLPSKRIKYNKI